MDITKENIDALNAVVKVKIVPQDYEEKVSEALKKVQKQVAMPGFRAGKVPASMVKKMYGRSVLADELNKILNDSLYKYIQEEKIEILGNPLPKDNNVDFENQSEFEFHYDMALTPQFDLDLGSGMSFTQNVVRIDDKLIDNYVNDITRRYGNIQPADSAADGDLIYGDFVELEENGEIKPGGIFKSSTMFLENPVKEERKELIGKKEGDKVVLDKSQMADNTADLAAKLGITPAEAEANTSKFQFTVKNVSRLHPAELNQDLFDKIYGPGAVTNVEEFRGRIAEELRNMFANDSERKLRTDIMEKLLESTNLQLPDDFLKRWLLVANDKPVTQEQLEAEYPMYARQLRWQLIENKLLKDNDIKVSQEEAIEHVKNGLRSNLAKYGRNPDEISDAELTQTAARMLSKEDEARKVFEQIYEERLMTLYRMKCNIETREVSYEEFMAL